MVVHSHKTEYYNLILDSADHLFGRYGYKKTTVEDIATDIGVSRATIYLHFSGKEEIALSWIDRKNHQLYQDLEAIANEATHPPDRIHKMLVARVMSVFDRACKFSESIDELLAALRPALFQRRELHHAQQALLFQKVIEEGQAAGDFQTEDSIMLARMLIISGNALMPYSLSAKQLAQRQDVADEINQLANFLLQALCYRSKINLSRPVEEQ